MKAVGVHEAKTHLSRLIDEEFVITRDGLPVAHVTPIGEHRPVPRIGFLPDTTVPDDFDQMAATDIAALFGAA